MLNVKKEIFFTDEVYKKASVLVSCKGVSSSDFEYIKRYLSDLGLEIIAISMKPSSEV